jgi:hypothetical protein
MDCWTNPAPQFAPLSIPAFPSFRRSFAACAEHSTIFYPASVPQRRPSNPDGVAREGWDCECRIPHGMARAIPRCIVQYSGALSSSAFAPSHWTQASNLVSGMRSYLRPSPPTLRLASFFRKPSFATSRSCNFGMAVSQRSLPSLPVFQAIKSHNPKSTAVVHSLSGRRFTYGELLGDVHRTRERLYEAAGKADIDGERVAFLVENSYDYVGMFGNPPSLLRFED